jgi:hypothetical protein
MKKFFLFLAGLLIIASCGTSNKLNRADQKWSYELESAGVGVDGTYAIKVWSFSRKPQISPEIPKMNAVHGVIFKGIPAGQGAVAQPPLAPREVETSQATFFDNFFTGDYAGYINQVAQGSTQVVKTGKNEFKIGIVLSVAKERLRKYLEESGIIKGLSSGF